MSVRSGSDAAKRTFFVASLRRGVSKEEKNQGSLTQRRYGATF